MANVTVSHVVGIDEVGRGAFAGPLIATSAYVTQDQQQRIQRKKLVIRDSKTLSEIQRERVYEAIRELQIMVETERIGIEDINARGIGWANTTAIRKLIEKEGMRASVRKPTCIVDGYFPFHKIAVPGTTVRCQVDADATIFPVILAGIVAKVTRDHIMCDLDDEYPQYCWKTNKGYGTREHIEAIRKNGICPQHRIQFVKTCLEKR